MTMVLESGAGRRRPALEGLRALVVCRHLGRASEVWLHRQITGFRRVEPTVLCWVRENAESYPFKGIEVVRLTSEPAPYDGRGRWIWRLRNLRTRNFYGAVGEERRMLGETLRRTRPQVILAQFGTTACRVLPAALERNIPVVAHFHGVDVTGALANPWYRISLQRCLPRFAAMVVVAEYQKETLVKLGAPPEKIHVIPCGVPVADLPEARQTGRQPCRFLAVGRLVEKKAPDALLMAFGKCHREVPDARLGIVGDGPLFDHSRRLVEELRLETAVEFAGSRPSDFVAGELQRSGVFLQHSVTSGGGDMEGWPVSIAEAMAAGLPVVSTRHAGITSQVVDGTTGFLVDERDWNAMGEAMLTLARDPTLRTRMGRAGRERAARCFDQKHMIDKLETVLMAATGTG